MRLIGQKEIMEKLGCSRPTLLKKRKEPNFPPPRAGMLKWLESDIDRWIMSYE